MWWIFATALLLLVLLAGRKQKQETNPDAQQFEFVVDPSLEHTIRVNVRILTGELDELETLAEKSTKTEAVQEAQALLASARAAASYATQCLAYYESSFVAADATLDEVDQPSKLLSKVFRAMDKTCRARHLLGAVRTDLII